MESAPDAETVAQLRQDLRDRDRALERALALQQLTARVSVLFGQQGGTDDRLAHEVLGVVASASHVTILRLTGNQRDRLALGGVAHRSGEAEQLLRDAMDSEVLADQSLARNVVATGSAQVSRQLSRDQAHAQVAPKFRPYLERFGLGAWLMAPIFTPDGMYGVLWIGTADDQPLGPDDERFATQIAEVLGLAITNEALLSQLSSANSGLEAQIHQRTLDAARARAIQAMTAELTAAVTTPHELLTVAAATVREHIPFAHACVILELGGADNDVLTLAGAAHRYAGEGADSALRLPFETPFRVAETGMRFVIDSGDSILVPSISKADALKLLNERFHPLVEQFGLGAAVFVAIKTSAGVFGVMNVYTEPGVGLTESDQEFAEQAAGVIGLALTTARLWDALDESNHELEARVATRTADLTAAQVELQEVVESLARSNEDLRRFAYVASHDLQAPLRTVGGFTEVLIASLDPAILTPSQRQTAEQIGSGVTRMHRLIRDLLEYTKVESTRLALGPVGISQAHEQVVMMLEKDIELTHAEVTCTAADQVLCDPGHLRQLLQNIIQNSITHRNPERTPVITTSSRLTRDGMVEISVADNGAGIPAQHQRRVFDMFKQLSAGNEGTGIGLAIVSRIIDIHGGAIWIDSDGKSGTTFTFTLPAP